MLNYKRINYKSYLVRENDAELDKEVNCIYLTKETKDLKKQLLREMNCEELGWEEKQMVKIILDKQKRNEEYQRQR